jgi:Fe-S-cluster containining protein
MRWHKCKTDCQREFHGKFGQRECSNVFPCKFREYEDDRVDDVHGIGTCSHGTGDRPLCIEPKYPGQKTGVRCNPGVQCRTGTADNRRARCLKCPPSYSAVTRMGKFVCTWCGKCCTCYGDFIRIERQFSSRDYFCRYGIKNESFYAHVQEDYIGDYPLASQEGQKRKGCPFMRKNLSVEGFACAIYDTRPQVCRDFRCYRMVIYDRDGRACGKIMGRNQLKTDDKELEKIWKEEIEPIPYREGTRWEKMVIETLAAHGYLGDPVE